MSYTSSVSICIWLISSFDPRRITVTDCLGLMHDTTQPMGVRQIRYCRIGNRAGLPLRGIRGMSNKSCEIQTRKANRSSRQAISNGDTAKRGKTWNNATGSRRPLEVVREYLLCSCGGRGAEVGQQHALLHKRAAHQVALSSDLCVLFTPVD